MFTNTFWEMRDELVPAVNGTVVSVPAPAPLVVILAKPSRRSEAEPVVPLPSHLPPSLSVQVLRAAVVHRQRVKAVSLSEHARMRAVALQGDERERKQACQPDPPRANTVARARPDEESQRIIERQEASADGLNILEVPGVVGLAHRQEGRVADGRALEVEAVAREANVDGVLLAAALEWTWRNAALARDDREEADDHRLVRCRGCRVQNCRSSVEAATQHAARRLARN